MSDFSVRLWQPGDEAGQVELWNRVFSEGNPAFVPRDLATWRHVYLANPLGQQTVVGTDATGRIVGNYSSVPVALAVRGQRRLATQVVDSCVESAFRRRLGRKGLFVSIAKAYQAEFCDASKPVFNEFIYGLPNENAFPVGVRLLGYTPVHSPMPSLQRALDPGWREELAAAAGDVRAAEVGWEVLPELEECFLAHLDEWPLANWRDGAYLAWRYRDWPGQPYRVVRARRAGRGVGAAIFRVGVPWQERPALAVVDWFGPGGDRAVVAALLAAVLDAEQGPTRLETWVTPALRHRATLLALGLHEEPTRFHLCLVLFSRDLELSWIRDHWALTMGDTDLY